MKNHPEVLGIHYDYWGVIHQRQSDIIQSECSPWGNTPGVIPGGLKSEISDNTKKVISSRPPASLTFLILSV